MTEYVYRVVDKNGVPYASGNTIKSVKTYTESTAHRVATEQTTYHEQLAFRGEPCNPAPYRVQRAVIMWEELPS